MNPAAACPSTGSQDDAATALRGASLAFQAASPPSVPHHSQDGASVRRSRSPLGVAADSAGDGTTGGAPGRHGDAPVSRAGAVAARRHQVLGSLAQLQPSMSAQRPDAKSPSFIAATLAASRSGSPSPLAATPRRKTSFGAAASLAMPHVVDSASIAPTGSLISLFEGAGPDAETAGKPAPPRTPSPEESERVTGGNHVPAKKRIPAPSPKPKGRHGRPPWSPQRVDEPRSRSLLPKPSSAPPSPPPPPPPPRSSEKISAMPMPKPKPPPQLSFSPNPKLPPPAGPKQQQSGIVAPLSRPAVKPAPKPPKARDPSPPSVVSTSTPEVLSPKPVRLITPTLAPPVLSSPGTSHHVDSSPSPDPEKRTQATTSTWPPTPPKPRRSQKRATDKSAGSSRRRGDSDTPLSRGSSSATPLTEFGLPIVSLFPPKHQREQPPSHPRQRSTPPSPLPVRPKSAASAPCPARDVPRRRWPANNTSTSNLTLDPLTSAIMASSLASSRLTPHNTGSSLPPPRLPQRQKSPRLLQTLRQPPQGHLDDDPERLKIAHRHKLSSNKHAHHEGSRNRWRDQITQRERKRYEAVWASNRGYLLGDDGLHRTASASASASECVANVVVRELWRRSRLPEDELVEVWELVDRGGDGVLARQEFIVGMWLIDQRLKGRKLPVRVSDSVWDSANGVRISKPNAR